MTRYYHVDIMGNEYEVTRAEYRFIVWLWGLALTMLALTAVAVWTVAIMEAV